LRIHKDQKLSTQNSNTHKVDIWAGIECTVTRIGDKFIDQVQRTGHSDRLKDLMLLADMGIKTIRYPVIWERVAPHSLQKPDWSWTDERLYKLRELNIEPIIGLLHHGSGPRYSNILDSSFPEMFAEYAYMVAERYPWVTHYTPVNEPLTTARFSGLYGIWYPHHKSAFAFCQILLNQLRGVVLGMKAIHQINPHAKLVQTEDLGKTYSTPALQYQADFENALRWVTNDLLTGIMSPEGRIWKFFIGAGIEESVLNEFLENNFPPSICGYNHYVTSERFLDENLKKYPTRFHGGNGQHVYADVEAVRVGHQNHGGFYPLLKEASERYNLPIALTEVHLDCTREEQLRWLMEAYNTGIRLKEEGHDFRAITTWASCGIYDWNTLLTRNNGYYESGVYDFRMKEPRPTLLKKCIKSLTSEGKFTHPVLEVEGWWKRPIKQLYESTCSSEKAIVEKFQNYRCNNPVLITGATGTLGRCLAWSCEIRGIPYVLTDRNMLDISDPRSVQRCIEKYKPWAIINSAGYVDVQKAESDSEACLRANLTGPTILARFCAENTIRLVSFSSDLVFDGRKNSPYNENDVTSPLNMYGISKAKAERSVLEIFPEALIIRTSAFFSEFDQYNFVYKSLDAAMSKTEFMAADDVIISPTFVPDLVSATLDLLLDEATGIWHISNNGQISWYELAREAVRMAKLDEGFIIPTSDHFNFPMPKYSALTSKKGKLMPGLEASLHKCVNQLSLSRKRKQITEPA
jgi:dTDP-4-dehydrorhamnose reductase